MSVARACVSRDTTDILDGGALDILSEDAVGSLCSIVALSQHLVRQSLCKSLQHKIVSVGGDLRYAAPLEQTVIIPIDSCRDARASVTI
jgi:hypothetical protein